MIMQKVLLTFVTLFALNFNTSTFLQDLNEYNN